MALQILVDDAALEEIIAPNIFKLNTRFNPTCGEPVIRIKNNGEKPIRVCNGDLWGVKERRLTAILGQEI